MSIKRAKDKDSYSWNTLTAGKLMYVHKLVSSRCDTDSLAEVICHEIEEFAYDNPKSGIILLLHSHESKKSHRR